MKLRHKLEYKLEKIAIPNLYFVIIVCIIIGFFIRYMIPTLYELLLLNPYEIVVRHQFWRLFTWILTNPYELGFVSFIFLPISLYFYYSLGRALENLWGRLMYNLYIFGGMLLTDILVVLGGVYYFILSPAASSHIAAYQSGHLYDAFYAPMEVMHYMLISIFLAFTVIGGDRMMLLYFFIPIKMKWLGYLDLLLLLYYFLTGGLFSKLIIIGSVANFFIYAYINKSKTMPTFKQMKKKHDFVKATQKGYKSRRKQDKNSKVVQITGGSIIPPGTGNPKGISIHKCAVCGCTEITHPDMEFRFCSKCNGNYEYCKEHLYTHEHVQ